MESRPENSPVLGKAGRRLFMILAPACCGLALALALYAQTRAGETAGLDAMGYCLALLVVLLAVFGMAVRFLGPRGALAGGSSLLVLALALLLFQDALVSRVRFQLLGEMARGLRVAHPRYGSINNPGMVAVHYTTEFRVTYTINPDGTRRTPPPPDGDRGSVEVVGCSFSFGQGVETNQTYAAQLTLRHWTRHRLVNRAVVGWGPTHAMLAVEDVLAQKPLPALVIYVLFRHSIVRSYRSKPYLEDQRLGAPHFDLEGGRLVRRGFFYPRDGRPPNEKDIQLEEQITVALVRRMHRLCEAADVPFLLHFWPTPDRTAVDRRESRIIATLRRDGIQVLDSRALCRGEFYPVDSHPTASCHRQLADAVAALPRMGASLGYGR